METLSDEAKNDLETLVGMLNGRMVPDTEILAIAQGLPEGFDYLSFHCGWSDRIESDPLLAGQIQQALAETAQENSSAA